MLPIYSPFGCPGDFFECDKDLKIKLIIDPNASYFTSQLLQDRNYYDKLLLIQGLEPKEVNDISSYVIQNKKYFDKILTSFSEVLENCENSELFLYASSWILTDINKNNISLKKDYHNIFNTDKKFNLSFVMSRKNFLPGHLLRFTCKEIIEKKRDFELFFPPSISISEKYKLFENSMFHIAIENTKNHNYISEKVIDCFMSYTIPIYWGCPNISEYFNTDGIIFFENEQELNNILDNLTINDYNRRLKAVKENYEIASNYAFYYDRINEKIKEITKN